MKESYRKGVAGRPGPESCVASRRVAIEALTGGSAVPGNPACPAPHRRIIDGMPVVRALIG